ncbi:hypothetical protein ABT369_22080 [Dactylosporangium sp. NPDC000244]|uniref:hypothetical protein n=1 Tax=Dactylosporangium sp. NPDC000244 TaxID=3154365 RepID=UPI00331C7015
MLEAIRDRVRRHSGVVRWTLLGIAALSVTAFLVAQRQSADVTYGQSPPTATITEGSAGELSDATLPSVEDMRARVDADPVVRLPGSIATWDEQAVRAAMGAKEVRIIVAPPGLSKDQQKQVREVDNATIRVMGTEVTGGLYQSSSSLLTEWRAQFARNDVTAQLIGLINGLNKTEVAAPPADGLWREPTAAELGTVTDALRAGGQYTDPAVGLPAVSPKRLTEAFGTADALVVALPAQPRDTPAPDYGPALAKAFPDKPLVLMVGDWIEYHGPHEADFADVAASGFYARFDERLSTYAYPAENVLGAYLGWVADVRYSGLFDRPLPYRPADPLRVALPVLPWLFAACVVGFLLLSAASAGPARGRATAPGLSARLAALSSLAVEVSGLTGAATDPDLTRAITRLGAARAAIGNGLPDAQIRGLLDDAERDLDRVGRAVGVRGYRPADYLRGPLA